MRTTRKRPKAPNTPRNVHATWARDSWRFRARVTVDGKRLEGRLRQTIAEATEDRDRLLVHVSTQTPGRRLLTLEEGMQLVFHDLDVKQASLETRAYYQWHFRVLWKRLGGHELLHDITIPVIEAFMHARMDADGVSPNTINKHIQALQRVMNLAVKKGYLSGNPIAHLSRPRNQTRESHWLPQHEVYDLLQAVLESGNQRAQRDHDVMAIFYLTGLRLMEGVRLRVRHVDLRRGMIQVVRGKTGYREIPIVDDLRPILFRLLAGKTAEDLVLPKKNTIQCFFQRWRERRSDPRLNARSLRHAFGSRLAQAGRTAHQIARLMGNSIRQANRYLHASGPQLREAISAVSLSDDAMSSPKAITDPPDQVSIEERPEADSNRAASS